MNRRMPGITALAAIAAITAMEIVALSHGIDGTLFIVVVATVAGIAGYELGNHPRR